METIQSRALLSSSALAQTVAESPMDQMRRYLRFRGTNPGELIALEALEPAGQVSRKFKHANSLLALTTIEKGVEQLMRISDDEIVPKGCFVHPNELNATVAAKYPPDQWIPLKPGKGIKNSNIASRRAFYFDFDPVRDEGVSSTTAERKAAFTKADEAVTVLAELLGDDSALGYGSSGNGAHVHIALDSLPNDEEVERLVADCLVGMSALFTDATVEIDTTVSDARRIAPAFGTVKRKGNDHRGEAIPREEWRPHRRTAFICRDEVRRLTLADLRQLRDELTRRAGPRLKPVTPASRAGSATAATTTAGSAPSPWDTAKAVDIEDVSDWLGLGRGTGMVCPGCQSTQGYGRVPGTNITKCLHNRCADKGVPGKPGVRTTIDLVCEVNGVDAATALSLLATQFGFPLSPPKQKKPPPPPPPAATGAPWESGLITDKTKVLAMSANLELILRNDPAWNGVIRFNEFANAVVFGSPPPDDFLDRKTGDEWTDDDDVSCANWFQRQWRIKYPETLIRGVVSLVSKRNAFDPMRDSLRSLVWDQVPRVDTWLVKYLGAEDTPYTRSVGRWWLVSAVARALDPGCKVDHTLILEGGQGAGKSTVVQILAGEDFFLENLDDIGSVESYKQLQGVWIIELAELDAVSRAELSTIKRFITTRIDRFRPSYARRAQPFPRRCVFIGTTNRDDYLADPTGGRRFWPVQCGEVDLNGIRRDRDALLAEAVVLFEAGDSWWPRTDDEILACAVEQADRYNEDVWTEQVEKIVAHQEEVTAYEVLTQLGVEASRMSGQNTKRVGAILMRLGWLQQRKREEGSRRRSWVRSPDAAPMLGKKSGDKQDGHPPPGQDGCNLVRLHPADASGRKDNPRQPGVAKATPEKPAQALNPSKMDLEEVRVVEDGDSLLG